MGFEGVPGHEFVADVVEGSPRFAPGTRVVGEINCGCGSCDVCSGGEQRHCPDRTVLGIWKRSGAMADFFRLPDRNLHALPHRVSDELAIFTEPVAAACRIVEQKILVDGEPVAILGDGKLGVLIAYVLEHFGHAVRIYGHHPSERAELFVGRRVETLHTAELRRRCDVIVEATGRSEGLALAMDRIAPLGRLILKTTTAATPDFQPARVVINEVNVIGSRCGSLPMALSVLPDLELPVASLLAATYGLANAEAAFAHAAGSGVLKIALRP